jgi:glutamate dehydrogenase (NAD(P)+)
LWRERPVHGAAGATENAMKSLYAGPVFGMAREQFHVIADHLGIPHDDRDRLLYPKRAIVVSCPIHMDDGRQRVFVGYRVQHHLTLGPAKGAPGSRPMSTSARSPRSRSG